MRVLVTGGAGYLGSHTTAVLLQGGHDVLVVDDLRNADEAVLPRVAALCEVPWPSGRLDLVRADVVRPEGYAAAVARFAPDAVIHFAGLKSVEESTREPADYYTVNVAGTAQAAAVAADVGARAFLFSSSATVYGQAEPAPSSESAPTGPVNPYGHSKLMAEQVLADVHAAAPSLAVACLRYFNPVGAHPSGVIGEDPVGVPANLMPFVARVADGQYPALKVFGTDYPTRDGTAVRDYIHVMDLAEAHVDTLAWMLRAGADEVGVRTLNIGRGEGVTVLEMVAAFERVTGRTVAWEEAPRRPGDIAESFAAVDRIARTVGWRARRGVDEMVRDLWTWQSANPRGFRS